MALIQKDVVRLKIYALLMLLSAPFASYAAEAIQPVNSLQNQAASSALSKELTALIAVPSIIELHRTRAVPITIRMVAIKGEIPQKITLRAPNATIVSGEASSEEGHLNLDVKNQMAQAVVFFPNWVWQEKTLYTIEVTRTDNAFDFLGTAQIKIRDQSRISVLQAPTKLPADSKTTGIFQAKIQDQFDVPLQDVPCFILLNLSTKKRQVFSVNTDANGLVTFTLPSMAEAGQATVQVVTDRLASQQTLVTYELIQK
ncbi:MAG TPA: hypothetical protein VGB77_03530 [Abditibacteriaceae bacterium]|jgi:hypothetical protein